MMGLSDPGSDVWVSLSDNAKRKLKHTWELVRADGTLVGINTGLPNRLVRDAIKSGRIKELDGYSRARREVGYGDNSRIDILLEDDDRPPCFVEIKNVHLRRTPGLAEFPDCITSRGAKHLRELSVMAARGNRAVMLFLVQRSDCREFAVARDIDKTYGEELDRAKNAGVEILCYDCSVEIDGINVNKSLAVF